MGRVLPDRSHLVAGAPRQWHQWSRHHTFETLASVGRAHGRSLPRPGPLLEGIRPLHRRPGDHLPIAVVDRFELAYESYLRNGGTPPARHGGRCTPSIALARRIHRQRGVGEPPTESFLETRTVQRLREFGYPRAFRQVPLTDENDRIVNRLDIVVPFKPGFRRPAVFAEHIGVAIEADGREHHADSFERDRRRNNNLVCAGARALVVTSNAVEYRPAVFHAQMKRLLGY